MAGGVPQYGRITARNIWALLTLLRRLMPPIPPPHMPFMANSRERNDRALRRPANGAVMSMRLVPYAGTERPRPRRASDKDRRAALLANIFARQKQGRLLSEIGAEFGSH